MNTPTKFTISRIILSFIIIIILLVPWSSLGVSMPVYSVSGILVDLRYIIASVLFLIASLTDLLDGRLARKNNEITNTGKVLDSAADKILVDSILIILASKGFVTSLVPVIIVISDIFEDSIKTLSASRGKVVTKVKNNKIKDIILDLGIILLMCYNLPFEFINIRIDVLLMYFATILTIFNLVDYIKLNKDILFPVEK